MGIRYPSSDLKHRQSIRLSRTRLPIFLLRSLLLHGEHIGAIDFEDALDEESQYALFITPHLPALRHLTFDPDAASTLCGSASDESDLASYRADELSLVAHKSTLSC